MKKEEKTMGIPQEKGYTVDDIYQLAEGTRAELIQGELYMQAAPSTNHQRISAILARRIGNHIEKKGGRCEVFTAPFAVFLFEDEYTYLEPDICVICDTDKLTEDGCDGAPEWVIEIVSPSSKKMDYQTKTELYQDAGVREYWIVDPEREMVTVYRDRFGWRAIIYGGREKVSSGIYPDLSIDFSTVFG